MKKYSFSIKEISNWYDSKREPFKKRGEFKSLLEKHKVDRNELLACRLNRENEDWIILREFNSLEERKAYHQIQKEHEKIASIRHTLLSIQEQEEKLKKSLTMDDYEEKEITLNSLYDKVLTDWKELKEQTQNEFHSDIIKKLIDQSWVNPLMYAGKIEGKSFYTKNPFANGGIFDKSGEQSKEDRKVIKSENFVFIEGRSNTKNAKSKRIEAHRMGKTTVQICCKYSKEILEKALKIGVTQFEYDLFYKVFNGHTLSHLHQLKYWSFENRELDIDGLLNEVFETNELIENRKVQEYFLESVFQDTINAYKKDSIFLLVLPKYKKAFEKKRKEWKGLNHEYLADNERTIKDKELPNLTIDEIALKLFYERKEVTRKNAKQHLKNYSQNSGDKLYQRFTFFSEQTNRRGNDETAKRTRNKISKLERVIETLSEGNKKRALDELKILESNYKNEFG